MADLIDWIVGITFTSGLSLFIICIFLKESQQNDKAQCLALWLEIGAICLWLIYNVINYLFELFKSYL